MEIDKLQDIVSMLKGLLSKTCNKEDNNKFEEFKNILMDESTILVKNQINSLNYYKFIDFRSAYLVNNADIKKLIKLYEEKIFELSPASTADDLYKKKLLQAKNTSFSFFENLSEMIVGDALYFPYRTSFYITRFFEEAGYPNLQHDGSTRRIWVAQQLEHFNLDQLYNIIRCLFKRKYFEVGCETLEKEVNLTKAKDSLRKLLDDAIKEDEFEELDSVFDINVNTSLLFNKKIETTDSVLNEEIESARQFYIKKDLQTALEKIWDAFERIKSLYNENKKKSVEQIVDTLSDEIRDIKYDNYYTDLFFNVELNSLTYIGNNCKIRHSEVQKTTISNSQTKEYLFFRMLNLINLIYIRMN